MAAPQSYRIYVMFADGSEDIQYHMTLKKPVVKQEEIDGLLSVLVEFSEETIRFSKLLKFEMKKMI